MIIATRKPRQAILLSGVALPRAVQRRSAGVDLNEPPRCTSRAWTGRSAGSSMDRATAGLVLVTLLRLARLGAP